MLGYLIQGIRTYGNGLFVALGSESLGWLGSRPYWSSDGNCWNATEFHLSCPLDLAFGKDRFLVVESEYSADDVDWTTDVAAGAWSAPRTFSYDISCIACGNGRFVAVGSSDTVMSSSDGSADSWSEIHVP
jgi:hypothetical protein